MVIADPFFCAGRPEKRATVSSATNLQAWFAQAMFNSIGRVLRDVRKQAL